MARVFLPPENVLWGGASLQAQTVAEPTKITDPRTFDSYLYQYKNTESDNIWLTAKSYKQVERV